MIHSPQRRLPGRWRVDLLLAAILGAGQTLAFVHTALWPLPLAAVGWLAWRVSRAASPLRAAALGWAFGTAWLGAGTWWIFISLHTYGGLAAWLAVVAVTLLSAFLSLYLAAAMALFARWRGPSPGFGALMFGAVWLLAELARGVIFTGFPWVASGYAQIDGPLAALAPWVGVYGIGFVGTVLVVWPVLALATGRGEAGGSGRARVSASVRTRVSAGLSVGLSAGVAAAVSVALFVALAIGGPGRFTRPVGPLSVTLLQGNVPQDEKFALEAMPAALAWTQARLLGAPGALVLGPETVIPVLPSQLDPVYWRTIASHFERGGQAAVLGRPLGDDDTGYTNSAVGVSAATATSPHGFYRYDKHHLVPFGEFIPNGFHWFVALMNIPLGDFDRGPVGPPSFPFRGERIGVNICYEDLFGEELAARFADAATAPTIFANISNIGWFGDTIAIPQHLQISRMRTLEFQIPTLRATNTGATAVIDADGHVTASLPPFTQGTLDAEVEGRTGLTPFARWAARYGLWPPLLLALAIVGLGFWRGRAGSSK